MDNRGVYKAGDLNLHKRNEVRFVAIKDEHDDALAENKLASQKFLKDRNPTFEHEGTDKTIIKYNDFKDVNASKALKKKIIKAAKEAGFVENKHPQMDSYTEL